MKKIRILIVAVFMWDCNYAQPNIDPAAKDFVSDLKNEIFTNQQLIDKHFQFKNILTQSEKEQIVYPIIMKQLDLVRKKLIENCKDIKLIKHAPNSSLVKSFKINAEGYDSIYYLTCNEEIIIPILIDENKNGVWDTGNYKLKLQPEKVISLSTKLIVKINWDNVIDINW